ncbi:MAG: hypothetical protein ABGY71_15065 [bacterium]
MRGSLAIHEGVVYVGAEERTAHVRAYDLDGAPLEAGFKFRGAKDGAAAVDGLAVDNDHRIWVADGVGGRVLGFSLVGTPLVEVPGQQSGSHDGAGVLGRPVGVQSLGEDDEQVLIVASGGQRRHGLHVLPCVAERRALSLRPLGEQDGKFHDLRGLALGVDNGDVLVCEAGRARLQVFRNWDYHRAIEVQPGRAAFEPNALAVCEDGRLVIAQGGERSGLLLCGPDGRLLRVLAQGGEGEGRVQDPGDVVLEAGQDDRHTRILVIDRDGLRMQVFNLAGDCWGTFPGRGAWLADPPGGS